MNDRAKAYPTCEIITIGSELLLGQIVDTNTTYLARALGQHGITIRYRTAVGDRLEDMVEAIGRALDRCDTVMMTGGLGPTRDDLTRQAVARVMGVDLEFKQTLLDQIEAFFRKIGYQMPDNNRRQAYIPAGSRVVSNPVGTAPGFIAEVNGKPIIALPGVPRELKYLLGETILPWLRVRFDLADQKVIYRVLKATGLGESGVDQIIGDLMGAGRNPEVGLLASPGEIKIRITATADDEQDAHALIRPVEMEIRSRLKDKIFGQDDDTLEKVVDSLLIERNASLAIMETFTGGWAARKLYAIPATRIIQSYVINQKGHLLRWAGVTGRLSDEAVGHHLCLRILESTGAKVSLVILGFFEKGEGGHRVNGYAKVLGEDMENDFSWQMGGDRHTLAQRGTIIGLNTLRLGLL